MGWLSGYAYRKEITITGTPDGAQTNYQMLLNIIKGAGSDGGNSVYLGNHALDWPEDIRFTKSDGETLLDFWREESDATDGTWWIEFDSISASPNTATFYIYYGKASDSDVSNGDNTFIQFDNFERGSDGDPIGGDWTVVIGSVIISTEQKWGDTRAMKIVTPGGSNPEVNIPVNCGDHVAIRFRYYKSEIGGLYSVHGDGSNLFDCRLDIDEDVDVYDSGWVDTTLDCKKDSWGLVEFCNFSWTAKTMTIVIDGATESGIPFVFTLGGYTNFTLITANIADGHCWVDNFIARNWTANEPSWTSWGSEETGGVTHYASATLSGAGTLAGIAKGKFAGKTTLAGVGTLSGITKGTFVGKATLIGTGMVACITNVIRGTKATMTGEGMLSCAITKIAGHKRLWWGSKYY